MSRSTRSLTRLLTLALALGLGVSLGVPAEAARALVICAREKPRVNTPSKTRTVFRIRSACQRGEEVAMDLGGDMERQAEPQTRVFGFQSVYGMSGSGGFVPLDGDHPVASFETRAESSDLIITVSAECGISSATPSAEGSLDVRLDGVSILGESEPGVTRTPFCRAGASDDRSTAERNTITLVVPDVGPGIHELEAFASIEDLDALMWVANSFVSVLAADRSPEAPHRTGRPPAEEPEQGDLD